MDKRETFRNLLISIAVFIVVMTVAPRVFRPLVPPTPSPGVVGGPAGGSERTGESPSPRDDDGGANPEARPPSDSGGSPIGGWSVAEAESEQTITIGAERDEPQSPAADRPYRMRLVLSNVGASVDAATMTDHAQFVRRPDRYELLAPVPTPSGPLRSLAVERINVDGADLSLAERRWIAVGPIPYQAERDGRAEQGQEVRFSLVLAREGKPSLELTRRFRLPQQPVETRRHDLDVALSVRNLGEELHRFVLTSRGGLGLPMAHQTDDRVIDVGVARGASIVGSRHTLRAVSGSSSAVPLFAMVAGDVEARLSWAATANTYFTCTIAPIAPVGQAPNGAADLSAVDLDGDPTTHDDVTVRLVTATVQLAGGQEVAFPSAVYLGEKENAGFRSVPEYRDRNYYYQISQGFGYCTFNWLVELMILLLDGLRYVVRDYGVAIIILVCIVRALLHPITKKGQVNMVRMQQRMGEFAPKMEELKRRFANDKVRLQQEIMQLYREHNINPASQFLTCVPMVIQLPVWAALYLSLSNNIRMRHEPFLFTWVHDLTAADALYTFASPVTIPLFGWRLVSFNLLPILVTISMYVQTKLQPKPKPNPNMSAEQRAQQESMQKMMPMMSIMMLLVFYQAPSGLNLYVMFSSLFGAIEQWWIRKHIKELEATGRFLKSSAKPLGDAATGRSASGGFFAKLQKLAEDAQKQKFGKPDRKRR